MKEYLLRIGRGAGNVYILILARKVQGSKRLSLVRWTMKDNGDREPTSCFLYDKLFLDKFFVPYLCLKCESSLKG